MYNEIIDFIKTTYKKGDDFIPLHEPSFNGNEKEYLNKCIDSTFVSSVGQYVDQFEELNAQFSDTKFAIAVVNGTCALQIALMVSGVENNDEVLTQSFSFVATANAISHLGAQPIFIDIDDNNLSLSPTKLEEFLKENSYIDDLGNCVNKLSKKRIKACIPMHTFGFMAKMDQLLDVCSRYNIALIEDAAEALGSSYKGKRAGSIGEMGVISFNGNKIITTGGGGVILTNNELIAKKAKHLTTTAKIPHQWEFNHDEIAFNYRLPNINAALGVAQLEQIENKLKLKKELFEIYENFFKHEGIKLWSGSELEESNYWLNTLVFNSVEEKEIFLEVTNIHKVMTRPAWTPLHSLKIYSHCFSDDMKNTRYFYDRVVNIPSSPLIFE